MKTAMKTLLMTLVLLGLGACASQPSGDAAKRDVATKDDLDQHCLKETGTKIKGSKRCVHGRVITAEEMERSGAVTIGDVLKQQPR